MNSSSTGDPPLSDLYPSAAPATKYNGSSGQAYFQHDFPASHQQNYRVYVAGPPNATPPTPPKHLSASAAPPPPPPPPKPPRSSSGSGNWMSDPSRTHPYPTYSLSDENLYMNGGPAGLMKLPPESSPIYSNRQEILNAQTYHQTGYEKLNFVLVT